MSFTQKIIVAMIAGIAVGALFSTFGAGMPTATDIVVDGLLYAVGQIFIRLLQMMVAPLVLASIVTGVVSLGDVRSLGRLGLKTLTLYLATTAIAIVLALSLARLVSPGQGFTLTGTATYQASPAPPIVDVFINMFPVNPIRAVAEGQMLQIIVFALLLGFAISLSGEAGKRIGAFFSAFNDVIMKMILLIVKTAPIGVFALLTWTFSKQGVEILKPLAGYFLTVVAGLLLHFCLTYSVVLGLSGLNPWRFFSKIREVLTFAFSTSSSSATIPVTLGTLERRLGVQNSVAAFTVPLGATINMDGTAIMQGVATVFIANVYGVHLTPADYLTVILTATLASIGTAAVPSAGLIMLAMVLRQVGLPVEGIGLIIGIDRLLDMLRTSVNVTGDCAVTCAVARSEKALDLQVFDAVGTALEEVRPEPAVDSPP
jgi:Na+/H+-dicarboxylate symporter